MKNNKLLFLKFFILFIFAFAVFGCGGGSSGTGEILSSGQIVDSSCQPLSDVELMPLGLETQESLSNKDGSFTITSSKEENLIISTSSEPTSIEISEPSCLIFVSQNNSITNTLVYPISELGNCSIETVKQEFPNDLKDICLTNNGE